MSLMNFINSMMMDRKILDIRYKDSCIIETEYWDREKTKIKKEVWKDKDGNLSRLRKMSIGFVEDQPAYIEYYENNKIKKEGYFFHGKPSRNLDYSYNINKVKEHLHASMIEYNNDGKIKTAQYFLKGNYIKTVSYEVPNSYIISKDNIK